MTRHARRTPFGRRLRWAGICLIVGLLIQTVTLAWNHPLAFTLFLGPGFFFIGAGLSIFLWAVFQQSQIGWYQFGQKQRHPPEPPQH